MSQIAAGRRELQRAIALRGRGAYVLQAAIASLQVDPAPDWSEIAALYAQLAALTGSAVVALNRAVAIAQTGATEAALALVDTLALGDYRYLHSTRAELLRRLGRLEEARTAFAAGACAEHAPNPSGAISPASSTPSQDPSERPQGCGIRPRRTVWGDVCSRFVVCPRSCRERLSQAPGPRAGRLPGRRPRLEGHGGPAAARLHALHRSQRLWGGRAAGQLGHLRQHRRALRDDRVVPALSLLRRGSRAPPGARPPGGRLPAAHHDDRGRRARRRRRAAVAAHPRPSRHRDLPRRRARSVDVHQPRARLRACCA